MITALRKIFIILIAFNFLTPGFSQNKALKKGIKKMNRGEFEYAILEFQRIAEKPEIKGEANYYIGEAYLLSNRLRNAEPHYLSALKSGYKNPEVHYKYALALKSNSKYEQAENELDKALTTTEDPSLIKKVERELDNLAKIEQLLNNKSYYRVKNLDGINTSNAEYSPVYEDGKLYFASNRESSKIYKATGTGFTDIYKVKSEGAVVDMNTLQALQEGINNFNVNEGSVSFSPDGRTIVFARGNSGKKKGLAEVNLYISRFRNREWSDPQMMNINEPGIWTSCPAFSANGRILYFASNREGGYGGVDLYQASLDRRGRFGKIRNLGDQINTHGHEMFPYISDDGKLYFASDGHPGIGGLDNFVAIRQNGKTNIHNLGLPINSNADDFGYFLYKADRGFFASNRDGGKGDDDIYTFLNNDPNLKVVNYFLAGVTKTRDENNSEEILPNVKVQLLRVENFETFEVDEITTGNDGKFQFRVAEHEHYLLIGEKLGSLDIKYFNTRMNYTTVGKSVPQESLTKLVTNVTLDTIMYLDKIVIDKTIVLENIYYDFGRWEIRDDAAMELDKLVDMLNDNPEINIELGSHTDSVDTESYNLRLSQRRAESAVDYIELRGINHNRISARGYGESRPIARNTNRDGTDNPDGRQKNRRTEFKVVRINENATQNSDDDFFDEDRFFDDKEDDGGG